MVCDQINEQWFNIHFWFWWHQHCSFKAKYQNGGEKNKQQKQQQQQKLKEKCRITTKQPLGLKSSTAKSGRGMHTGSTVLTTYDYNTNLYPTEFSTAPPPLHVKISSTNTPIHFSIHPKVFPPHVHRPTNTCISTAGAANMAAKGLYNPPALPSAKERQASGCKVWMNSNLRMSRDERMHLCLDKNLRHVTLNDTLATRRPRPIFQGINSYNDAICPAFSKSS